MLLRYLHAKRNVCLCFGGCFAILTISFALYHLPLLAVLYPSGLCVLLVLLLLFFDYRRVCRTVHTLSRIQSPLDIDLSREDGLPTTVGPVEVAYAELLLSLRRKYEEERAITQQERTDLLDYFTTWVHQIKTPTTSMRLHLQNEDSPLSRQLTIDLSHVEQYVDMVLTYIRLGSPTTDFVFRTCSLDSILKQSLRKCSAEFILRRLHLVYTPCDTAVVTDEKWLSFVIEQILSNALKYTGAGGTITITVTKIDTTTILAIRDTGIGIDSADLPRIFEPGYTGEIGRTQGKTATGLGLYLCRRITTQLGHEINATSTVGEGTEIAIRMPSA